jgi:hypothetical protein
MIRECERRASQLTTRPNVRANQRTDPDHLEVDGTSPDWGTLCRLRLIERAGLAAELVSRVRPQMRGAHLLLGVEFIRSISWNQASFPLPKS